jgi:hypothetical protein
MKITMECDGLIMTWEVDHDDVVIDDVMDGITACLRGLTWSEAVIMRGYQEAAEEYNENLRK